MGRVCALATVAALLLATTVRAVPCENRTTLETCVSARDCTWVRQSHCTVRRVPAQLARDEEWVVARGGDASALACDVLFPFARFDLETRACEARGDAYCASARGEDECTATRGCVWDVSRTVLPCAPAAEPDARRVAETRCAFDTRPDSGAARWLPCARTDPGADCAAECKRKGPACAYAPDQMPNCVPVSEKRAVPPPIHANTPRDSYTPPPRAPATQTAYAWAGASDSAEVATSAGLLMLSVLIVLLVSKTAADSESVRRVDTKTA